MKRAITFAAYIQEHVRLSFIVEVSKLYEPCGGSLIPGSILFVISDNRLPKNTIKVVKGRKDGGEGVGGAKCYKQVFS